jgi:hypothetical protein
MMSALTWRCASSSNCSSWHFCSSSSKRRCDPSVWAPRSYSVRFHQTSARRLCACQNRPDQNPQVPPLSLTSSAAPVRIFSRHRRGSCLSTHRRRAPPCVSFLRFLNAGEPVPKKTIRTRRGFHSCGQGDHSETSFSPTMKTRSLESWGRLGRSLT